MLKKIRLIVGIILGIIALLLIVLCIISIINKEDPNVLDQVPQLSEQEQKTLKMEIETQSLPMPGINE